VFHLRTSQYIISILDMPNTYSQLHIQVVFAVKYREALISSTWKEDLHKYITGIIQGEGHKMLRVNSMPDHLHLFFGYNPNQTIPDLIRKVKSESSKWINQNKFTRGVFRWQEGYAAFSYARSQVKAVAAYVANQEAYHKKVSFQEEYIKLLDAFEVEYDPKYLFRPPE
jgi:putative transposase